MKPSTVALVVYDSFSPFHLAVPCLIFGNDILRGERQFDLKICSDFDGPVINDQGFSILPAYGLEGLSNSDVVIVPGWHNVSIPPSPRLTEALRRAHARGAILVGLCLGTYALAYAGLLEGKKASTHWEAEADFSARFPSVKLDANALYVEDDGVVTSAGTGAGVDCCLYIVRQLRGSGVANQIARRMVVPTFREGGQAQFIESPIPMATTNSRINAVTEYLRTNLSSAISLDDLALRFHMSRRTLTRNFQKATGKSIKEWILAERLRQSQELLECTSMTIEALADIVGFGSVNTFRYHFKRAYGISPLDWRNNFRSKSTGNND